VDEGEDVLFVAEASGQEPLSYQWQFNGTNLPGATSAALTIPSAQVSDSGEYSLVVTNALGLIHSRPARLTVLRRLQIVTQPVSQTVAPGSTVTLSVGVAGHPPPIYQWRLNGVNIPGAIYPTYTIPNAQPVDGGSYQVVVANLGGAISSEIARVVVTSPGLGFADDFADRGTISGLMGVGSGSNGGASVEGGEPDHAGKLGGRSVWVKWTAPADGIAIFNTRGSSFDTLLAVYTGTNVAGLSEEVADEDRGGFLTSRAAFNAEAGVEYAIAVDGLAGAAGNLVLSWSLDTSTVPFPRILNEPLSQTVTQGQTATFTVDVFSPTPETYQWFRACRALAGATDATLTVTNVQHEDVDEYRVVVMNASARVAESVPAVLEIGPVPDVFTRDKVEDVLHPPVQAAALVGGFIPVALGSRGMLAAAADGGAGGFISVALGSIDGQIANNEGAQGQLGEPNHCGVLGGASRWFGLRTESEGTLIIDTIGSAVDTVLAVYRATNNPAYFYDGYVTCDNNGAADGIRSLVSFEAGAGAEYFVAVDGVNGAGGEINLNWRLGRPSGLGLRSGRWCDRGKGLA